VSRTRVRWSRAGPDPPPDAWRCPVDGRDELLHGAHDGPDTPRGNRGVAGSPLLASVARAVGLQEGEAGVRDVLRAIRLLEPASTRSVSRQTGLPVPLVAAVANELRARGVVSTQRPSRLTDRGRRLLVELGAPLDLDPRCTCCQGYTVVVPPVLQPVVDRLATVVEQCPAADLTLDQSHCTAATKVRRVLYLIQTGTLPGASLLLVGDDDLMSLSIAAVAQALGQPLVSRLAVVDISAEILDFVRDRQPQYDLSVELVRHDLREAMPDRLLAGFDAAMTDPPYTVEGARLFLSRAVEGLRPGAGQPLFFSFGPKGPDDLLAVQRGIAEIGLTVQALHRNFNEYTGSGILGGTSHLYQLTTTSGTRPVVAGGYPGPLYTGQRRTAGRVYACQRCGRRYAVGPRERFTTIAALKAARCEGCGWDGFRPRQLTTDERPRRDRARRGEAPGSQP
jgi:predicted methyltransferase/DNA-directed RNA polymerase subunit RPC12/RpoP